MDWIKKVAVQQAAKDGEMASLICSLVHHKQGATCTRGELIDAIGDKTFHIGADFCACCHLCSKSCEPCVLTVETKGDANEICCDGKFIVAKKTLFTFEDNPTPANFAAFQEAEKAVCDYIQAVIDKKAEPEEVFGVGDRFTAPYSKVKAILAAVGTGEVMMISLQDGSRWGNTRKKVKDIWKITQSEFDEICCDNTFTRYWDAAKQAKVGEKSEQGKSEGIKECTVDNKPFTDIIVKATSSKNGITFYQNCAETAPIIASDSLDEFISALQRMRNHIRSKT